MRHVVACECVCCSALGLFPRRQQGWKMGTRLSRLPAIAGWQRAAEHVDAQPRAPAGAG